jgi:putative oxidoreductase
MLQRFLATDDSSTRLFQRLVLGAVMFPHGAQKLLGWFDGYGFAGTMSFFTGQLGMPAPIGWLVIAAESVGALALIAGLATRLTAFGIAAVMTGAVALTHLSNGFFMNWTGAQAGEGVEYHLLVLALALPLVLAGGGAWSMDNWLARSRRTPGRSVTTARRQAAA